MQIYLIGTIINPFCVNTEKICLHDLLTLKRLLTNFGITDCFTKL